MVGKNLINYSQILLVTIDVRLVVDNQLLSLALQSTYTSMNPYMF